MRGKHLEKFRWTQKRIISAILSAVLLFTGVGFSTYAWLTSRHEPVVNEFIGSKLVISLTPDLDQGPYKLIPGVTYTLNGSDAPLMTVEKDSVECYLFVVVHETDLVQQEKSKTYYGSGLDANIWDYTTVPYGLEEENDCTRSTVLVPKNSDLGLGIVAANSEENQTFTTITTFTVRENLTKTQVHPDYFVTGGGSQPVPKIRLNAYAIQTLGIKGKNGSAENDLLAAWEIVKEAIVAQNTKKIVLD